MNPAKQQSDLDGLVRYGGNSGSTQPPNARSRFVLSHLRLTSLLFGMAIAAIVFYVNYSWITWHFYFGGAYLLDSGLLADVIWRNPYFNPRLADIVGGDIYNGVHFTPLLNLANAISYGVPLGRVEYYATYQGLTYAIICLVMFFFLSSIRKDIAIAGIFVSAVVALVFSFNGFMLSAIFFPHFEMLWPAMAFGFFWAILQRRLYLAIFFFVFSLAIREDGGLQLACFLLLLIVVDFFRGIPIRTQKIYIVFVVIAIGYSVIAILLQNFVLHGAQLFRQEFLGKPTYAHLSWDYVQNRFLTTLAMEPWVFITILVVTVFAIIDRRPSYLMGFAATAPWVVLYMLAPPGGYWLNSYRTFPLVLGMVWPALEIARSQNFKLFRDRWLWCTFFLGTVSLVSMAVFQFARPELTSTLRQAMRDDQADRASFDALARFLDSSGSHGKYGRIVLDDSVIALSPRKIAKSDSLRYGTLADRFDGAMYWRGNKFQRQSIASILADQGFGYGYRLDGTNVLIASRVKMTEDQILGRFLKDDPAAAKPFPNFFQVVPQAQISGGSVLIPPGVESFAIFGPYAQLEPGSYEASFDILTNDDSAAVGLDVAANAGRDVLAQTTETLSRSRGLQSVTLRFDVTTGTSGSIELRVSPNRASLLVKDIRWRNLKGSTQQGPE